MCPTIPRSGNKARLAMTVTENCQMLKMEVTEVRFIDVSESNFKK